jgi:hypothetical protein
VPTAALGTESISKKEGFYHTGLMFWPINFYLDNNIPQMEPGVVAHA